MAIAKELKRFREQFGYSQADVASKLNMSRQNYAQYEFSNNPVSPRVDVIINLANICNVSADYLLGLTDEPRPLKSTTQDTAVEKPVVKESAPVKLQVVPPNFPKEKPFESLQERLAKIESALLTNGIRL